MEIRRGWFFVALLLAGCRVDLPPVSRAFVAHEFVTLDSPNKRQLTPSQQQGAIAWFERQRSGWSVTIPDTYPDTILIFQPASGEATWVYLWKNEMWSGSMKKTLTDAERKELKEILGE